MWMVIKGDASVAIWDVDDVEEGDDGHDGGGSGNDA